MPFLDVKSLDDTLSHRIYYRLLPEGGSWGSSGRPRVILLQGLGGSHVYWKPQSRHLEKYCDICAVDNRGIGWSEAPANEWRWTTRKMANDALQVLDSLGWNSGVHVIGISMGGMIAQELALASPHRVASLSLIATIASFVYALPSPKGVWLFGQSLGIFTLDKKAQASASYNLSFPEEWLNAEEASPLHDMKIVRNQRRQGKSMALLAQEVPPELKEAGYGPQNVAKTSTMLKQLLAVVTHKIDPTRCNALRGRRVPVSIIHGDSDILVRPVNSELLSKLFAAPFHLVHGCGHGLTMQTPDEINKLLDATISAGEAQMASGSQGVAVASKL